MPLRRDVLSLFISSLALALVGCITKTEQKKCFLNGKQVNCDDMRPGFVDGDREIVGDPLKELIEAEMRQRSIDSAQSVKDSLTRIREAGRMTYLIPPKAPGSFVELPAGTLSRADGKSLAIKAFLFSNVELTHGMRAALLGKAPVADSANLPLALGWEEAVLACNAASARQAMDTVYGYEVDAAGAPIWSGLRFDFRKNGYRLPTEAEWEYAARAGTATRFHWGDSHADSVIRTYAWGDFASLYLRTPKPVARRVANPYGLYDMYGNLWEFTMETRDQPAAPGAISGYPDPDMEYHVGSTTGDFALVKGGSFRERDTAFTGASGRFLATRRKGEALCGLRMARTSVPNGVYIDYAPDGSKRSSREYRDGAILGTRTTWLAGGDKLEEYFDGKAKTGQRRLDSIGRLIVQVPGSWTGSTERSTFILNGTDSIQEGPFRVFWHDTILVEYGEYLKGKRVGVFTHWDTLGIVAWKRPFVDGREHGNDSSFTKTGKLAMINPWVQGVRDGLTLIWNYPDSAWKPWHNLERLNILGTAGPIVSLTRAAGDSTLLEKRLEQDRGYSLTHVYHPDGSVRTGYQSVDSMKTGTTYPEWYPSGALKTAYRFIRPSGALFSEVSYSVKFAEDGTCLLTCDKLLTGFVAANYSRPVDIETEFRKGKTLSFWNTIGTYMAR